MPNVEKSKEISGWQRITRMKSGATVMSALITFRHLIWSSRGVVYDESDEIALPLGRQSAAWLDKARKTELGCGHWNENRLWSHYYLVSFPC